MWIFCGNRVVRCSLSVIGLLGAMVFWACGGDSGDKRQGEKAAVLEVQSESSETEFCRNLWLGKRFGESVVEIRSIVGRDTLIKRFVLRPRGAVLGDSSKKATEGALPEALRGSTVLRVPLERVVALSSAQVGYMLRLGLRDRIVGVGEGKYLVDSALYAQVASGLVAEVGNGPSLSLEKIVALSPGLVMDFATGGGLDDYERVNALGLPLMLTSEWQEQTPLAKAEWIKLYGKLFGVEALADSIFEQSKNAYLKASNGGVAGVSPAREGSGPLAGSVTFVTEPTKESEGDSSPNKPEVEIASAQDDSLSSLASRLSSKPCPRVLAGMSYGGVWHAPGGNSLTATLIRDAGGCYLWASDTSRELRFTLEEIIAIADSADLWVNPGMFSTPEELLMAEPRIKYIRAFREKRVYQNDGRKGPGGGNDFFESAVAYPAELLQNLRSCIQDATNGADSVQKEFDWYHNIFIF